MNRLIFASACAAFVLCQFGTAIAAAPDGVLASLQKCKAIADDKARLACYDGLVPSVQAALAAPPPQVATATAPAQPAAQAAAPDADHPATPEQQKAWFGLDVGGLFGTSPSRQTTPQQFGSENVAAAQQKTETATAEIDSISAGVTDYAYTAFGKFIVFLDNGQEWRQIPGDTDRAMFKKNPKDNTVAIERGLMGSYNLMINGSSRTYKVQRVK